MNPAYVPLAVAVIAFFTGIGGSLVGGYFLLKSKDKEHEAKRLESEAKTRLEEANLAHQIRDELRADNKELKNEIEKLETKIRDLGTQMTNLTRDLATKERSRRTAELEAKRELKARQTAEAQAKNWQERYEREHRACNLFAQLHDFTVSGRNPDAVMLETINRELTELGYLSKELAT